ncbi:MAG: GGDEF domain-containing protein [Burkholderiales bacterium]|nr:GGDEF domain-containing protein [Burkholderiales bacterium]
MFTLDIRSISLTLALCGFALVTVLWTARRDDDEFAGLDAWTLSAGAMSAGLGFSALQGWTPDWLSRVLGNALLVAAPMLAWQGARSFRGVATSYRAAMIGFVLAMASNVCFVYVWPSARLRIIITSVMMCAACIAACSEFLRRREPHLRRPSLFGGVPLGLFAVMMAIRVVNTSFKTEAEVNGIMVPSPVNVATYLLGSVVLLTTIAGMVMSVTATQAAQIRELAYRDALTAVLSRRGLYAALGSWLRTPVGGQAVVLVFDLNNFKQINDRLGHEMGDRVLQALASACTSAFPADTLIARLGGDEFVAVLRSNVALHAAMRALDADFGAQCERLLRDRGAEMPTVASGHALWACSDIDGFDAALHDADRAMYVQKTHRRSER